MVFTFDAGGSMNMKLRVTMGFLAAVVVMPAWAVDAIPAVRAGDAVGRTALVCGTVAGTRVAENAEGQPLFFFFEERFPRHKFSVRIDKVDLERMPAINGQHNTFVGKIVCAEGEVTGNRVRPEMQIREQSKIKLGQSG